MAFLFSSYSVSPLLSLHQWQGRTNTNKTIVPLAVSLKWGKKMKMKKEENTDKRDNWSRRKSWLLPPGAVGSWWNLREIAGGAASMRDQRGSLSCFAYLKCHQLCIFPAYLQSAGPNTCTHALAFTNMHIYSVMACSAAWHNSMLSAEHCRNWHANVQADGSLRVSHGYWQVRAAYSIR